MSNNSGLERLVNALHMPEVWNCDRTEYEKIKANPSSTETCRCAKDLENYDVMKMPRLIALEICVPALQYGKHILLNNGTVSWSANMYSYGFTARTNLAAVPRQANETMPQMKNEAA